jgi:solute carrier family 35
MGDGHCIMQISLDGKARNGATTRSPNALTAPVREQGKPPTPTARIGSIAYYMYVTGLSYSSCSPGMCPHATGVPTRLWNMRPSSAEPTCTDQVFHSSAFLFLLAPLHLCMAACRIASILTQSATKVVLTVYNFNFPITLCLAQMLFAAPICAHISGSTFDVKLFKSLLPLGLVNGANIVAGLFGTGDLTVPMFIVLRRFTMVITIVIERLFFSSTHNWQVLSSVGVMISGALIAAAADLAFNLRGYVSILTNDLLTSIYLIMVKNLPAARTTDTYTLLYYNALISMVPLAITSIVLGDMPRIWAHPALSDHRFLFAISAAVGLGLSVGHSQYLCTRVNDPLTTSVSGSLKNILMTGIGIFAFGDYVYDVTNVVGICISMVGGIWYALYTAFSRASSPSR